MNIPLYSTVTLIAELFVSSIIFYSFYQGFKHNKFPTKFAAAALAYEILFNITYMIYRVPSHAKAKVEPPYVIILAILHGTLSLIMFVSLIVFFILAWKNYRRGVNYFLVHKKFSLTFLIFWSISVISGILFYILEYLV